MENLNEKLEERKKALAAKREETKRIEEKAKKEAMEFVESFKKAGNKYITIRIRDGFIGKEMTPDGRVLQPYRTKPRGTMVAFKNPKNDKELIIGISYLHDSIDKDIPIIGVAEAIKYGIENAGKHYMAFSSSKETDKVKVMGFMNNKAFSARSQNDKELYEFFKIRSLCYFYPEIYSHSRGSEKIEYPNYEKIHKNRARVLGD